MTVDTIGGGVGAQTFPVAAGDDLDPAQTMFLALFRAAINAELGEAWQGIWQGDSKFLTKLPVESTFRTEPDLDNLRQTKQSWPILALYRSGEPTTDEFTLWQGRVTQSWRIEHVLGPVDVVSELKARPFLERERALITRVLSMGGHPVYAAVDLMDHRRIPADVFAPAGLSVIRAPRFQIGAASHAGSDTKYFALGCSFETHELETGTLGVGRDFEGVSVSLGTGNGDGELPALVNFRTDVAPALPDDGQ